ncbi:DapH/DapD/GlmU-related protein [Microbacterium sp. PRC9]|uniref:DapH/DapD/GlmU-related protein n=1 Tax=Microbacterium sp. PRC9 TaxID=2962591 RepID=UPI00288236C3|nr:DapH/DapD/GlmU-related protein [Microbacterium sp. PRC9]MDT0144425.1 DapH/DapD/GlmU-related protein [Microbacterium sp. PRC9]
MSPAIAAHEYSPWDFWSEATPSERDAQLLLQQTVVAGRPDHELGEQCFLSELASIDNESLRLGDRTYVAAGAYLTGDLRAGADCSINPYTVIRGRVTMGDGVRIGAHTSILGFNHSMESGTPVFRQPLTSKGIEIGDDVWIGSHVVILDGVSVGSHSVLAASAVVTKDVPAGAVVGGNPARFIRWRVEPDDTGIHPDAAADAAARGTEDRPDSPEPREPVETPPAVLAALATAASEAAVSPELRSEPESEPESEPAPDAELPPDADPTHTPSRAPAPGGQTAAPNNVFTAAGASTGSDDVAGLAERVAELAARARGEASVVLQRAWNDDLGLFTDRPGAAPTVRAQADAIEIADLLLGTAPPQASVEAQIRRLQGWQDATTGAVAPLDADGRQQAGLGFSHGDVAYHVLSTGYALDLLGSAFPAPLTWVTAATPERVVEFCESLPWTTDAWGAGHHIDGFGTAILWTKRAGHPIPAGVEEALFGWLLLNTDPQTGMWGSATPDRGILPVVNGFYRASRGTFAQFGVPLPHPDRVIDTVLRHARDPRWFAPGARNACNVLDVAHPLWLARGTGYRDDEVRELAARLLSDALATWVPGAGFSFREPSPAARGLIETEPGLQGTEMWLAILWYLADLAGVADALGYRPRGVHRPEPAATLR